MSNKIRAILLKKIKDETILLESLSNLRITYTQTSTEIQLNEICKLIKKDGYFVAEITENYYISNLHAQIIESNKLIQSIILKYDQILNEKIKDMHRKKIEEDIIDDIKKQETEEKERKRHRELLRLEDIRRAEQKALELQIQESILKIIENSEKNGYSVKEEKHQNERILVLVRR